MKIKQVVATEFHMGYCSYNGIEFTDRDGNEVSVRMSDDQLLEFAEMVNRKAERVKKEQLEAAREQLEKEEVADE
jgi:hypothetical protein